MQRSKRVVLLRPWPPGIKIVTVRSFTVGRFRALLDRAGEIMVRLAVSVKTEITPEWLLTQAPLRRDDWTELVDFMAPDQAPGWFRPWFCLFNLRRVLRAFGDVRHGGVNDWQRIQAEALNLSGKPREDEGSLDGDIVSLCGRFAGMTPFDIYGRDLIEFLDMVRGLAALHRAQEKKEEPVAPLSSLVGMGLGGVVH